MLGLVQVGHYGNGPITANVSKTEGSGLDMDKTAR